MFVQQKKTQVTIFLMLGVIMVITIFVLIIANRGSIKSSLSREIADANKITLVSQPVKNFVEECFSLVSKNSLDDFNENSTEEELERFVDSNIDSCLDFSVFEEQGLSFLKKSVGVKANINEKRVVFRMEYPIIITRPNGDKIEMNDFLAEHELMVEET
tara:strand:+ start:4101 stop:4577 length:477 start_codon:yes stop_codon:yes gene_type:complete